MTDLFNLSVFIVDSNLGTNCIHSETVRLIVIIIKKRRKKIVHVKKMRYNVDNKRYASPIFVSLSHRRIRDNAYIQSHTVVIVKNVELLNDRSNADQLIIDIIE